MAPKSNPKAGGTSRIRFIMVDAEIADGDITSVTQAITNALKGPDRVPPMRRLAPAAPAANGTPEPQEVEGEFEPVEDDVTIDVAQAAPRQKTPRKPAPKPKIIEIDITSESPLSSLGTFTSHHKRYLAIAAWLHDHRSTEVITVDHVYTCYRHLGWPINLNDFAAPFRVLKHKQYFTQPESGKYAINQLGLAKAAETAVGD